MKKYWKYITALTLIITVFLFFSPFKTFASFSFSATITVNNSQVPSTQTNFPMLFSGTYDGTGGEPDLRTTGNGGDVQNANGYDIGFYSNSNCSTGKLDWEMETYAASTGVVNYWVEIPSISDGTVIYLCYGDASISTDQSNPTGVWDTNFKGVYHLPNGSSLSANSSTGSNNGSVTGAVAGTGKIDGAFSGDGSGDYITVADDASLHSGDGTLSAWVKTSDDTDIGLFAATDGATTYNTTIELGTDALGSCTNELISYIVNDPPTAYGVCYTTGTRSLLFDNNWHHIVITADTTTHIYLDGSSVANTTAFGTDNGSFTTQALFTNFRIGGMRYNGSEIISFNGLIDEFRFSTTARTANWITTEYNNQSSPGSFYAVGNETPVAPAVIVQRYKAVLQANVKYVFNGGKVIFR